MPVTKPDQMNDTFARAFNSRKIENLLVLYEPDAVLRIDDSPSNLSGLPAISHALRQLLELPGTMTSRNRFCVVHGDLAATCRLVCHRRQRHRAGQRQFRRDSPATK